MQFYLLFVLEKVIMGSLECIWMSRARRRLVFVWRERMNAVGSRLRLFRTFMLLMLKLLRIRLWEI